MWRHADETPSQTEMYVAAKRRRLHAEPMLRELDSKAGRELFAQQGQALSAGNRQSSAGQLQPLLKTSLEGRVQDANSRCSLRKQPANNTTSTTEQGAAKHMRTGPAERALQASMLQNEE